MPRSSVVTKSHARPDPRRALVLLSSAFLVLALLIGLATGARAEANADAGQEAADFVRGFSNQAIVMLTDETLDKETRTREFRTLLTSGFHLELISRFVLGRHWRKASEAERAEFTRLFEDYLVASYAQKLGEYGGEQLEVLGGRPKGKSGAIVSSRIVRPQGDPFQVEWRLRRGGEGWRIIDVVVEGVSMAVTHRQLNGAT